MKRTLLLALTVCLALLATAGVGETAAIIIGPRPKIDDVSVCGSIGFGGVNVKGCIGTEGTSIGASGGVVGSVGVARSRGWDGATKDWTTGSVSGGGVVYGTGTGSIGKDPQGNCYGRVSGGVGVGIGTEGLKGALTIEGGKTWRTGCPFTPPARR